MFFVIRPQIFMQIRIFVEIIWRAKSGHDIRMLYIINIIFSIFYIFSCTMCIAFCIFKFTTIEMYKNPRFIRDYRRKDY